MQHNRGPHSIKQTPDHPSVLSVDLDPSMVDAWKNEPFTEPTVRINTMNSGHLGIDIHHSSTPSPKFIKGTNSTSMNNFGDPHTELRKQPPHHHDTYTSSAVHCPATPISEFLSSILQPTRPEFLGSIITSRINSALEKLKSNSPHLL